MRTNKAYVKTMKPVEDARLSLLLLLSDSLLQ